MEIRPIDANALLEGIEELKRSPWYNGENGNYERLVRNDAIGTVIDLCIKSAPTLDLASKWISVKDRLPGEDPVLILVKETEHYGYNKEKRRVYYCQYLAYWDGDEWFTTWCNGCRKISDTAKEPYADDYEVTHWMPLPEGPKEDEKDEKDV